MPSPQTLDDADRHLVALWAADCAERVLSLFEAEAPEDTECVMASHAPVLTVKVGLTPLVRSNGDSTPGARLNQ